MARRWAQIEQLLRDSQSELFAYLVGRLGHREEALDALQDVLLAGWRNRKTLGKLPPRQQVAYLYTAARNRTVDLFRSRGTPLSHLTRPLEEADTDCTSPPEPDERIEQLSRLIARLAPSDRVLIHLSSVGGLNCNQIAERLECPAGTVRSRLARLKQRLRSQMEGVRHETE